MNNLFIFIARCAVRLALACFAVGIAFAAAAQDLSVGSPAPKLDVISWIKGEPTANFKRGTVYVVEFWATWCGPCTESIPHLTAIQAKFGARVKVIGIDCLEPRWSEVKRFVSGMGGNMAYSVAMDRVDKPSDTQGHCYQDWMKASGRDSIPTAFLIGPDGVIAWIGEPVEIDKPLASVLDGTYKLSEAKEGLELEARLFADFEDATRGGLDKLNPLIEQYNAAIKAKDLTRAIDTAQAVANLGEIGAPYAGPMRIGAFIRAEDPHGAITQFYAPMNLFELAISLQNSTSSMSEHPGAGLAVLQYEQNWLGTVMKENTLAELNLYLEMGDVAGFRACAENALKATAEVDIPEILNGIAWQIVVPNLEVNEKVFAKVSAGGYRNCGLRPENFRTAELLSFAKESIDRAVKLVGYKANYLDTLGWVYYRLGDIKKAAEMEDRASGGAVARTDKLLYKAAADYFRKTDNSTRIEK